MTTLTTVCTAAGARCVEDLLNLYKADKPVVEELLSGDEHMGAAWAEAWGEYIEEEVSQWIQMTFSDAMG